MSHCRPERVASGILVVTFPARTGNAFCPGRIRLDGNGLLSRSARANSVRVTVVRCARCSCLARAPAVRSSSQRNDWNAPAPYSAGYDFGASRRLPRLRPKHSSSRGSRRRRRAIRLASITTSPRRRRRGRIMWSSAATPDDRATELYRSAVRSFIESAVRFGRFDRQQGVMLASGQFVPVTYQGFVWQPDDFCTFLPVGSYDSHRLSNHYVSRRRGRAVCGAVDEPAAASVHERLRSHLRRRRSLRRSPPAAAGLRCSFTIRCARRDRRRPADRARSHGADRLCGVAGNRRLARRFPAARSRRSRSTACTCASRFSRGRFRSCSCTGWRPIR